MSSSSASPTTASSEAVQAGGSLSFFERYLSLWVSLCIGVGIGLGHLVPQMATLLDSLSLFQVSLPIAVCLFCMMYPIMVKIDFGQTQRAINAPKPVLLTLAMNWLVKPFTMVLFAQIFLGGLFQRWIPGSEQLISGETIALSDSYIAGAILLGVAPCTAMVLMWGYLCYGNQGHTLAMVALNSLAMVLLYAPLGRWLLATNDLVVPWATIALSVLIYVGLPLAAGILSRRWILRHRGLAWFNRVFLPWLSPVAIVALLLTLVLLFALKGELIWANPGHILLIAVPLTLQTLFIFALTYGVAKSLGLVYEDAAPAALIGASNHFEVAIATAVSLFGLNSGAALATVVGVLIEVPLMLALVEVCKRTAPWFPRAITKATLPDPRCFPATQLTTTGTSGAATSASSPSTLSPSAAVASTSPMNTPIPPADVSPPANTAPRSADAPRSRVMPLPRVMFVCRKNSARSQMAEAFASRLGEGRISVTSSGLEASEINPGAIEAMAAVGYSLDRQYSKALSDFRPEDFDWVISLCGCGVSLPDAWVQRSGFEDWDLPDPAEAPDLFPSVRDQIHDRVQQLLTQIAV
ncbi:MAG: ACR3 family arsenite efflux transporter [Prochlorothrix sp.]|nr:ACR3 family arsenite efflux transporter [Prochlorothrix sp.]